MRRATGYGSAGNSNLRARDAIRTAAGIVRSPARLSPEICRASLGSAAASASPVAVRRAAEEPDRGGAGFLLLPRDQVAPVMGAVVGIRGERLLEVLQALAAGPTRTADQRCWDLLGTGGGGRPEGVQVVQADLGRTQGGRPGGIGGQVEQVALRRRSDASAIRAQTGQRGSASSASPRPCAAASLPASSLRAARRRRRTASRRTAVASWLLVCSSSIRDRPTLCGGRSRGPCPSCPAGPRSVAPSRARPRKAA